MGVAIGSEIGFEQLGHYYGHEELAGIVGKKFIKKLREKIKKQSHKFRIKFMFY